MHASSSHVFYSLSVVLKILTCVFYTFDTHMDNCVKHRLLSFLLLLLNTLLSILAAGPLYK